MMRFAIIQDGSVVNIAVANTGADISLGEQQSLIATETANIGDTYDGESFHSSPSEPVAPLTTIFKADIWRRATDAEAAIIDAELNAQPVRLRRMWQDSQTLATTDEMYPAVYAAFLAAFGEERAKQLLAPSS